MPKEGGCLLREIIPSEGLSCPIARKRIEEDAG